MSGNHYRPPKFYLLLLLITLFFILMIFACKDSVDVYSPKELRTLFQEAGGWIVLPFPDSKYKPGSIISVTADGVRWIDHLNSCGYPPEALGIEKSYIPSIQFTKSIGFAANALINFKGIQAGPEFGRISKVNLRISDHGADAFRIIQFVVWMEQPSNAQKVSGVCLNELKRPNRFLVTEAFRVSKGQYTLYDKSGSRLKLELPALKALLQFDPDVKYELSSDGSLAIEQDAVLAVRRTVRIGDNWETLKNASAVMETADSLIDKLYLEQNAQ